MIDFKGTFIVFLPFGVMVFWGNSEQNLVEAILRVESKLGARTLRVDGQREWSVNCEGREDIVSFREVRLVELTLEHIKVISEGFGQSVALHRCQDVVQELFGSCHPLVEELQAKGDIRMSSKEILKLVGKTLSLREGVLSKLALIDTPSESWQSERLSRLHGQLQERFCIKQRLQALQTKLDYLLDLNETLMNLIRHHESHRLEWIIIILIVIEVIYSTIQFFIPAFHNGG